MKYFAIGLLCLLSIGVISSSFASDVILEPGEYKLEWNIPKPSEENFSYSIGSALEKVHKDLPDKLGLASERCLFSETERFRIFLDESEGTGKGFDTAYLIPASVPYDEMSLDKAAKFRLKKAGYALIPDISNETLFDIAVGSGENQQTKQAALDLRFEPSDKPEYAYVKLRGGWRGKVKSNIGDLEILAIDANFNGTYNDKIAKTAYEDEAGPILMDGDVVVFISKQDEADAGICKPEMVYLGKVVSCFGRLYEFELSPLGDTIKIKRYEGESGTLYLIAKDGFGKPAAMQEVGIEGNGCKLAFDPNAAAGIILPAGNYDRIFTMLSSADDRKTGSQKFGVYVAAMRDAKIVSGKTTVYELGGPVRIEIEPTQDIIQAKLGETITIGFKLTVGKDQIWGFADGRKAAVRVRDGKNRPVLSGEVDFSDLRSFISDSTFGYSLKIPNSWKPGIYQIGVSFDPAPYQKPVYATKKLEVSR